LFSSIFAKDDIEQLLKLFPLIILDKDVVVELFLSILINERFPSLSFVAFLIS